MVYSNSYMSHTIYLHITMNTNRITCILTLRRSGIGGMVAPYIAILVHRHSWDVLATVDLLLACVVVRRRACIGAPLLFICT